MSKPILIDPLKFAREGRSQSGQVPVCELDERVHSDLSDTSGTVSYELTGFRDELQRFALRIRLTADLRVTCQRCLDGMPFSLDTDSVLTLFTSQEKLAEACELNEELDAVLAEPELDVTALIEDEIIMGLPHSPKHDECGGDTLSLAKADKPNPFAVLAALKRPKSE
ncbi:metal-binding protein [Chromobacterium sp. ATCC 53434]|uniref:YceD family protein n=1 Tax=Chromobacterium TaxID=535 RepID=UPI000C75B265|nr:YceD family protein [Chromobacterium sp. ATCC 53434]AUH50127.1 metal-binding protein [Chromobacterium sp. ATCC 53434]